MAQVRIAHSLNEGEKKYLLGRKISVQQCLEKNKIPCSLSKLPNIAVIGSGGGQRAMVGMLGSLYQMGKEGLLDAALYMSGVSGSTWCMASVYAESDWSSNIQQIKNIAKRIGHDSVSINDRIKLLIKYHRQNANFSLTDIWAAGIVPMFVKNIDESTLSNYKAGHDKDPYPIYTVINQDCKYQQVLRESFFELTPHEAGYSLAGAFVETSKFSSIFNKGVLVKEKMEMDMTYLQGACGSALADKEEILKFLKKWLGGENMKTLKDHDGAQLLDNMVDLHLSHRNDCDRTSLFLTANQLLEGRIGLGGHGMQFNVDLKNYNYQNEQIHMTTSSICQKFFDWFKDLEDSAVSEELQVFVKTLDKVNEKPPHRPGASHAKNLEERLQRVMDRVKEAAVEMEGHDGPKLLLKSLELNNRIISGEDWTPLVDELNALLTGKETVDGRDLRINKDLWVEADQKSRQELALGLTFDICQSIFSWFDDLKKAIWNGIVKAILALIQWFLETFWIWGTNYNFLNNMTTPDINPMLLKNETTHFEDAGLLDNSPYMSVLRAERNIDLIISFDFSEGDPMETVSTTAKLCTDLGISFPSIQYTKAEVSSPKSFYVGNKNKSYKKVPTVIHMPLFNIDNCGSKLESYRDKYTTFQLPYSPEMIEDLMTKAGENVKINKKNILREIESIVKQK